MTPVHAIEGRELTDEASVVFADTVSGRPVTEPVIKALRRYQSHPGIVVARITPASRNRFRAVTPIAIETRIGTKKAFVNKPANSRNPSRTASRRDCESR